MGFVVDGLRFCLDIPLLPSGPIVIVDVGTPSPLALHRLKLDMNTSENGIQYVWDLKHYNPRTVSSEQPEYA